MTQTVFSYGIDVATGTRQIQWMREALQQTRIMTKEVEKEGRRAISKTIHGLQMAWGLIQGVIRAAGGTISMTTRLVISAGFGAIQAIVPILKAESIKALITKDPVAMAQVIAGFAQVGLAVASLIAYQSEEKQLSRQLRGANYAMSSVGHMLYAWG